MLCVLSTENEGEPLSGSGPGEITPGTPLSRRPCVLHAWSTQVEVTERVRVQAQFCFGGQNKFLRMFNIKLKSVRIFK